MATLSLIWSNEFYRKLIATAIVLLLQGLVRRVLLDYAINRISDDSPHLYLIRKAATYSITIVTALLVFGIWIQRLADLSVALGILGAGIAFALQEVIGSIAGWITIVTGKPLNIGDRVETGGIRGDVIDIGVLRTTLMEIGNWLDGDQNTGRIVTLSNAFLFKEPLYNYSRHIGFIWDEITIPVTYEADWRKAIEIVSTAVRQHPAYQELLPKAEKQRRATRRKLAVKMTSLEPRVYVRITDNWIALGLVYPVATETRRNFKSEVSQQILSEFARENITVASQTIAIVQFPDKNPPG